MARRRTQAERTEATTGQLIKTARELFARDGYAATSLEAVSAEAGVTKGGLYHHFGSKQELFEAVFKAEQQRLLTGLASTVAKERDPWDGLLAGAKGYLEACLDPGVQRITLLDASSVLGWERMREIEADYGLALIKVGLLQAQQAGRIRRGDVDALAHLLFGALGEGAMYIARAPDPPSALRKVLKEVKAILNALATVGNSRASPTQEGST